MAKFNVSTPFNIELEFETASVFKRGAAYLIDLGIASLYVILLFITVLDTANNIFELFEATEFFLIVLPLYFYHLVSEILMNGQTAGKKIMGLRVLNANGHAAGISQYMLRWILSFPNIVFIGAAYYMWSSPFLALIWVGIFSIPDVICMAITGNGKRIGDLAANTVIVSTKNNMDIEQTIFKAVSADTGYKPKYPEVMRLTDKDINNLRDLLQQKRTKDLDNYTDRVAQRIEVVLSITNNSGDAYIFFDELLTDYNYYTQNS